MFSHPSTSSDISSANCVVQTNIMWLLALLYSILESFCSSLLAFLQRIVNTRRRITFLKCKWRMTGHYNFILQVEPKPTSLQGLKRFTISHLHQPSWKFEFHPPACHYLSEVFVLFCLKSSQGFPAFRLFHLYSFQWNFAGGSDGKVSTYNAGDLGSIPGSGRYPGEGNGNPCQYSCLERSHGWRSYSPWDHKELNITGWLQVTSFQWDTLARNIHSMSSFMTRITTQILYSLIQFSSVAQLCLTLHNPMDCSTQGFPVYHQLLELAQTHVHWVSDAIQLSHPLSSPSPPAFNLSQHQGLFRWVSSSQQVAKVLEFQLQHQSFQWIFRTNLL